MNFFMMLIALFVASGHCSTAMALVSDFDFPSNNHEFNTQPASSLPHSHIDANAQQPVSFTHSDHDQDTALFISDTPLPDHHTDGFCPDTPPLTQSLSAKQTNDHSPDGGQLLVAAIELPFARAGPCAAKTHVLAPDFITPPLFHTLCVLRL